MGGHNKGVHMVTFLLLVIGGLNWLLVGAVGWDVGELFGGMDAVVSRVIYVLVGLSAVYELVTHKANCAKCKEGAKPATGSMPTPGAGGNQPQG
ncbi:MAG: hypothetical protein COT81_00220 [Candidatus Buchananbacteria bacterium CG10_big_fil_rev_8_21_14_0_10_42_9]|uniref:DUF378 domain-containing protein n=1 Tax=Candidatus Buchananbacteria bacterium CG10_big_fil_rev_8_21_14_0_10_42_9 TaxID=1974526 RepID=A0A2H0W2I6_9BACT|nr:MAG: hypothetical protein COT81_00220 [Candidatus Buchananbacteria bacterium CG10_big_fil_rev_8_21_14_0_10_42_9]